jgi:hypothetical protein
MLELAHSSKVLPSGSDLATNSAPKMEPAPGLFSTIQLRPVLRAKASANIRPMTSLDAPGVKGTIRRVTPSVWAKADGMRVLRASVAQPSKSSFHSLSPLGCRKRST